MKNRTKKTSTANIRVGNNAIVCQRGPTIDIAVQIERLNSRDRTIQSRLGVIHAESSKLYAEQAGIQVKRLELMRAFDGAAKP